jgi:hypothetical protein
MKSEAVETHTWPPLKKALWNVIIAAELNGSKYVFAFDLADKLYEAALSAAEPVCTVAVIGAGGHRWLVPHPPAALETIAVGTKLYAAPLAPSVAKKVAWAAKAAVLRSRGRNNTLHDINQAADYLDAAAALSAQVHDVAGTVEAFDKDHPELYWHIAKGKITAGEPLYGAIITDLRGNELGDGESNVSAIDAFNIAVDDAALPAAPAKQEG